MSRLKENGRVTVQLPEDSDDGVIASERSERSNPEGCEDEIRGVLAMTRLLPRAELLHGKKQSAQVSLELAFSLICLMVLVWGSFNIFLWLNQQMLNRQEYYAATRQKIAEIWVDSLYVDGLELKEGWHTTTGGGQVNKPDYPKLDVFKP